MRMTGILIRVVNKFSLTRTLFQYILTRVVLNNKTRILLNTFYNKLSFHQKRNFHSLFAKIFRKYRAKIINAVWTINFVNSNILIPLEGDSLWLDWDTAISILGHDEEIKRFYEKLIMSEFKPSCFFDIGANYGTHSLLFLSKGIKTISFEPNPYCKPFFEKMANLNNLDYHLENLAIGNKASSITLIFPEEETWLGKLSNGNNGDFQNIENVKKIDVQVITLDEYVQSENVEPDLIKIDTEGYELKVIQGAKNILDKFNLIVIFESNAKEDRIMLFQTFESMKYNLFDLRALGDACLKEESFLSCVNTNFLAIKSGHAILEEIGTFA